MMNNLANVDANELLPDGFTSVNPNGGGGGGSSGSGGSNNDAELQKQAIQQQKQMILQQTLDAPALARLGRIKMVNPSHAASIENSIVSMAVQNKLPGKISEGKLIEILERNNNHFAKNAADKSAEIQIQRKRYSIDSDDEDDDDDDI